MGNAASNNVTNEDRELLMSANFSDNDIKRIYKKFITLDTNKNGQLDIHELFDIPEILDNPIVKRVISIFDRNNDGKVSFIEFLIGLAKLSTEADELVKTKFAFDIYDIQRDGYISNGELFKVMKMLVGNNLTDIQLQQLVDRTIIQADKDYDGMISYSEFQQMISHINLKDRLSIDI